MSTENPEVEAETDTDILLADPSEVSLQSGFPVKILRLKTRALLALLRILMRGTGDALFSGKLDPNDDEFQKQLVFAVLLSIPEGPDETLEFLRLMVEPAQLRTTRTSKGDDAWNEEQWQKLDEELIDPDLEDLIDIVVVIVQNEAPHIQALGKKLTGVVKTMGRTLQKTDSVESAPKKSSRRVSKASTRTTS